jgi:hypothetical protein
MLPAMSQVVVEPASVVTVPDGGAAESPGVGWPVIALSLCLLLAVGELGSRLFWALKFKAPLISSNTLRYAQYPLLRETGADRAHLTRTRENYDILILGESTVSTAFGKVGAFVQAGLVQALKRPVRVFNLAYPARNSRDSLLQYRWLSGTHFDLVIVYDGICDARMDNAPPDRYRDDYSHCHWYQLGNRLDRYPTLFSAALPYTLLFAWDRIAETMAWVWYVPLTHARKEWTTFGKRPRSPQSLKRNLKEIVDLAQARGDRVLLMTLASWIMHDFPPPATDAAETIGERENVAKAVGEMNVAIRDLARVHPQVVLVDQANLVPTTDANFYDCCHLQPTGQRLFARNILDALR